MATYRILSLDGGGVRGLLTARILERLDEEVPGWRAGIDLIAATSTGAILGLALADGLGPSDIADVYRKESAGIFHESFLHKAASLGGLVAAKYSTENRRAALAPVFGERRLRDLSKKVLVPTFDLDCGNGPAQTGREAECHWKPKFFHNFDNADSDGDELALDVVMRTSAPPVYFPIYQGYIDGGMIANNPSVCALAQALSANGANVASSRDVLLLSIGTGFSPERIESIGGDWGVEQWNFRLVSIPIGRSEDVAHYQCGAILGDCYERIQPRLPKAVGLDDVGAIDDLDRIAGSYLDSAEMRSSIDWVRARWMGGNA